MMNDGNNTAFLLPLQRNIVKWIRQGDWSAAEEGITELKKSDPLSLDTRGLELDYLIAVDRHEDAESLARQLINLFPASSRIHLLAGKLAYKQKNYVSALPFFEESYRLYPNRYTERYIGKTLTQAGDFSRAEPILVRLASSQAIVLKDLAWLYERKNQFSKAQEAIRRYLKYNPRDEYAKSKLQQLQAHALPADQVIDEVQTLTDFDEEIPVGLLTEYTKVMLEKGRGGELRSWMQPQIPDMKNKDALQAGWVCHKLKAYDLAFELLIKDFASQYVNIKYRGAIELSAQNCGQLERLIELYEQYAERDHKFYGRATRLRKRLG